jgi:phospholipase/lecithinase/hemolysin
VSALPNTALAGPGSDKQDFVFFGDSLSDTGNRYFDEGAMNTPPYDLAAAENLIPSLPYAIGGPTYTNGKVWIEYVATALGRSGASQAALRSNGIAANYAYSGARASNLYPLQPNSNRNLGDQVVQYIADKGPGGISPDTVHVILIGGNDISEAVFIAGTVQDADLRDMLVNLVLQNAIEAVFFNASELANAGAERFLLLTAPNAGYVPVFGGDPLAIFFSGQITDFFNCAIVGINANFECPLPELPFTVAGALTAAGAEVRVFDANGLFENFVFYPEVYGLTNTTDHCIKPFEPPFRCDNPDEYLFWDNVHPTGKVHELIGNAVIDALSN